ncbi:uncharacterized protein LOC135393475 [Ornithodoros turicata]|uniref:uncharacterized protein LOC135393475 n=1 Tax=Ornithodoros turicata TaxID=34597 RepID=UPI0031399C98
MSYPVTNTKELTYKQMETVTKARNESGIHIMFTSPFISQRGNGEVTVCKVTRTITEGTKITVVASCPELNDSAKYRIRHDESHQGNMSGMYMEFLIKGSSTQFYQHTTNEGDQPIDMRCETNNKKGAYVLQLHVQNNGSIKVYCNGEFMGNAKLNLAKFGFDLVYHRIDQGYDPIAVLEIHYAYTYSRTTVFNTVGDFMMPELPLSPGAYLVWEGNASGTFTVKYKGTQIYSASKRGSGLRLVMEMFINSILIGLDGEQSTCVVNPKTTGAATNTKHPLVLSSGFTPTNFVVQTGSRSPKE